MIAKTIAGQPKAFFDAFMLGLYTEDLPIGYSGNRNIYRPTEETKPRFKLYEKQR